MDLPHAILEETINPDHVVLVPQEDGSVHMLLYSGETETGFVSLKYVILDETHVDGIARGAGHRPVAVPSRSPKNAVEFRQSEPQHTETLVRFDPLDSRLQQAPVLDLETLRESGRFEGPVNVAEYTPTLTDEDILTRF